MSCDHPNDADMEGYVMARLSNEPDTKQLWSVRHNGCPTTGVVRSGLGDTLFWIEVHEQQHESGVFS